MKVTIPFLLIQVALVVQVAALPKPQRGSNGWAGWGGAEDSWTTTSISEGEQSTSETTITTTSQTTTTTTSHTTTTILETTTLQTTTSSTSSSSSSTSTSTSSSTSTSTSTTTSPTTTSSTSSTSTTTSPTTTSSTSSTSTTTSPTTTSSTSSTSTTTSPTTTSQTTTSSTTTSQTTASPTTTSSTTTSQTTSSDTSSSATSYATGLAGNNTLNSTVAPTSTDPFIYYPESVAGGQLQVSLVNNYNTNATLNAYITGIDSNGRLVMVQSNGHFYYPVTNSTTPIPVASYLAIPLGEQGSTTTLTIPGWLTAGRIWVSSGTLEFYTVKSGDQTWSLVEPSVVSSTDPNIDVVFGFVELTNDSTSGLYVNISYVDFVGLALGISVTSNSTTNSTLETDTVSGVTQESVSEICDALKAQEETDGYPWGDLCFTDTSTDTLVRVLSPASEISINSSAFSGYWSDYVDEVWEKYASESLTINTQSSSIGNVSCSVSDDVLVCDGSSRTYAQPSAADIFGCSSGPFEIASTDNDVHEAIVPRLCAAFNRSTLLLDGGNVQPGPSESEYYTVSPTNHYSRIVHAHSADGVGYAFSYDDVVPDGGVNESGLIAVSDPTLLTVTVQS